MITCKCPAAASLPDIPAVKCAESFGQIQKVAFQRLTKDDGSKNSFTTEKAITLLASWTPLLSAANSTKIVVSPYIQAPTNEAGAARTFGGGNETLGGVEEIIGREPNPFTGVMRKIPQSVIKAMKEMQCESWADNLGVYLFNENGSIEAIQDETTPTTYYPIPIRSLFIGDKTHGGLEAPDSNAIQWAFLPNYSDNLTIIAPEFNPLTDLKVAVGGDDMAAKVQKVALINDTLNVTEQFEITHAERLLRMPNNGGWRLPENSDFKFDKDDGIGYKRNKKADNGAEKAQNDK